MPVQLFLDVRDPCNICEETFDLAMFRKLNDAIHLESIKTVKNVFESKKVNKTEKYQVWPRHPGSEKKYQH